MPKFGLDIGTKNIVLSHRDDDGNIKCKREVNGFYKFENSDKFAKNMLINNKVPFIESEDGEFLIALGKKAEEIAYTFGSHLSRPMEDGVLSVSEKEAMKIMATIIYSIVGDIKEDSLLYYCIPGSAINDKNVNVNFHDKIIGSIMSNFKSASGFKVDGHSINEARALVLSEFPDGTGIGISFGAGMVNVSYCLFGMSVYEFSIVGSGDKIDMDSAKATGNMDGNRPKALVTRAKEEVDLSADISTLNNLERAISLNYQLMIGNVVNGVVRGFKENEQDARASKPMPIVCGGGTSMATGFMDVFRNSFNDNEMPFEVGEIIHADNPLYAVSAGCLVASEMHE